MPESSEKFIAPEQPTTKADFKEVADNNMTLHYAAQSEVREEVMGKLSPEQRKILGEAKLQYSINEHPNRVYNGSKDSKEETIQGTVNIEGEGASTSIQLTRGLNYNGQELAETVYIARIDGEMFTGEKAKELFEFYLPIMEAVNETTHYPTERYQKVLNEKTFDKLLGK
jgi:hypothetical protein